MSTFTPPSQETCAGQSTHWGSTTVRTGLRTRAAGDSRSDRPNHRGLICRCVVQHVFHTKLAFVNNERRGGRQQQFSPVVTILQITCGLYRNVWIDCHPNTCDSDSARHVLNEQVRQEPCGLTGACASEPSERATALGCVTTTS